MNQFFVVSNSQETTSVCLAESRMGRANKVSVKSSMHNERKRNLNRDRYDEYVVLLLRKKNSVDVAHNYHSKKRFKVGWERTIYCAISFFIFFYKVFCN